jgi:hypothetical protein
MNGAGGRDGEGDDISDIVDGMEYIERLGDGRPVVPGLSAFSNDGSPGGFGVSFFRNKLDIPDTIMPGCMPSSGESKLTIPRIRC